jgi:hypothetical protein
MSYLWIEHRKDGTTHVERRGLTGNEVAVPPKRTRGRAAVNGCWQESDTNGFVGDQRTKAQIVALDATLGVPIEYREVAPNVYRARFDDPAHKRKWLRAHKRVDLDAGYRDPCPGDFRGQYLMEGQ